MELPLADDQDAHVALLIANTVSKEVTSSLAGLLREIEVRLTTVINNLATANQEQQRGDAQRIPTHQTFNFTSEVSKGGREQEFVSKAKSQRGQERESPKPEWLEKSLASGKVSMQDLENDHADHLMEARLTEDIHIGRATRSGAQRRWMAAASSVHKKPTSHLSSHDEDGTGTAAAGGLKKDKVDKMDTFDALHLSESSAVTRTKNRGAQSYAAQVAQALSMPRMLPFSDARPSDASESSVVQHEVFASNGSRRSSQQEGVSDAKQHRPAALPSAARRFRVTHPEPVGNVPPPGKESTTDKQRSRPSCDSSDGHQGEASLPPALTAGMEAAADGERGTKEQAGDRQAAPTPERSGRRFHSFWSTAPLWSTSEEALPVEEVRLGEGPISYVSRQILSSRKEFSDIMPGGAETPQETREPDSFVTNKKSESFASNKNPSPGPVTPEPSLPSVVPAFDVVRVWDEENATCRQLLCPPSGLAVFRGLVLAACVSAALFCIRQHLDVANRLEDPEVDSSLLLLRLLDLLVALGSLASFLAGWRVRQYKLLVHTEHLLGRFTYRKKMVDTLRRTSVRRWYMYLFLWLLSLTVRFLAELDSYQMSWPGPEVGRHAAVCVRVSMFAISSGVLVWCMHFLDRLCRIMVMMVDAFCFYCAHSSATVETLVDDWNILQALLRHTAGTCEASILLLLATVSAALVTAILGPMQAATAEPRTFWVLAILGPLVLLSGSVLMKAAQVTEKCKRVPSVANSMIFRFQMGDRFYLTHYISWSNAGFYVREVLINGIMVLKVGHLGFLAVFAVLSRLLAMG